MADHIAPSYRHKEARGLVSSVGIITLLPWHVIKCTFWSYLRPVHLIKYPAGLLEQLSYEQSWEWPGANASTMEHIGQYDHLNKSETNVLTKPKQNWIMCIFYIIHYARKVLYQITKYRYSIAYLKRYQITIELNLDTSPPFIRVTVKPVCNDHLYYNIN